MSERAIQNEILLAASAGGFTLFRNNVGMGWTGQVEHLADGSIRITNPRPLHAGLCKGSSDLIGWRPLLIGPEHLGQIVAQFSAVEVKTSKGRATKEQAHFLEVVEAAGGVAVLARCPGDLGGIE